MLKFKLAALALVGVTASVAQANLADDFKLTGKQLNGGFELAVRKSTAKETIIGNAVVRPESWADDEITAYVARFSVGATYYHYHSATGTFHAGEHKSRNDGAALSGDRLTEAVNSLGGKFVTGLRGRLEKFDVSSGGKEAVRLVFRNAEGQFITWIDISDQLEYGWNRNQANGGQWVYEVRYKKGTELAGQLVNSRTLNEDSKEFVDYTDGNACKRLVIRESADGNSNGEFLTVVAGKFVRREDGEGWCYYYATDSAFENNTESRQLTSYKTNR